MALDIVSYAMGKKAGGVQPTGEIEITQNGITNVSGYATANVQVPEKQLEEKSVTISSNTTTLIEPSSGKDGMSSVSVTTNIPQPSGKITITENGNNIDVSSYATADVSVGGGVLKNILELNQSYVDNVNSFCEYLNTTFKQEKQAYTSEPITLYTPNTQYKQYMIYTQNGYYYVAWLQNDIIPLYENNKMNKAGIDTQHVRTAISKNINSGSYSASSYYDLQMYQNSNRLEYYQKGFTTLQEAIDAIQNSNTTYTKITSGYIQNISLQDIFYNNFTMFYNDNGSYVDYNSIDILSQNETIQVIE